MAVKDLIRKFNTINMAKLEAKAGFIADSPMVYAKVARAKGFSITESARIARQCEAIALAQMGTLQMTWQEDAKWTKL